MTMAIHPFPPDIGKPVIQYITHPNGPRIHPLDSHTWDILWDLIRENHEAAHIDANLMVDRQSLERCNPSVWVLWHEGRAVGYCAHIIGPHLFTGEQTATCAAIYVRPAHRDKVRKMLDHIEEDLRSDGVTVINYSVPHLSKAGAFFERIGYECAELVMRKRISP